MKSTRRLIATATALLCASLVASCGSAPRKVYRPTIPATLLTHAEEPQLAADAITVGPDGKARIDDKKSAAWNAEVLSALRAAHAQIDRACRFADRNGMKPKGVICPPATTPDPD